VKTAISSIIIMLLSFSDCFADKDLVDLSQFYYSNGEYYNAATELMRFQHLYPNSKRIPESMYLMGKSYYRGGNIKKSQMIFKKCYYKYPKNRFGELSLYSSGVVRLYHGAPYFSLRDFQEYRYVYKNGEHAEDAFFNSCAAYGITENHNRAYQCYMDYREKYPDGRYSDLVDGKISLLKDIENRDRKSPVLAGLSSALIPGSGYFYTGQYKLGLFSMCTNGALIYLIYDSYKKNKNVNLILFSLLEISFYNYSIIGSIRSAGEYNRSISKSDLLIGIKKDF